MGLMGTLKQNRGAVLFWTVFLAVDSRPRIAQYRRHTEPCKAHALDSGVRFVFFFFGRLTGITPANHQFHLRPQDGEFSFFSALRPKGGPAKPHGFSKPVPEAWARLRRQRREPRATPPSWLGMLLYARLNACIYIHIYYYIYIYYQHIT